MSDAAARDELARGLLNCSYDDLNPVEEKNKSKYINKKR